MASSTDQATAPDPDPDPAVHPAPERHLGPTTEPGFGPGSDPVEGGDAPVEGEEAGLEWRRPHPFTIIIEIGSAIRSMAIALVAVGGGFVSTGTALELVVVGAPLLAALGRWYTTRYALGAQSIYHQFGLIRRRKQVLPRANVQNVSTRAGLVARIGSVVEVQISDASATGDIKLRLVSMDEAERITTLLRTGIARPAPDHAGAPSDPRPAEVGSVAGAEFGTVPATADESTSGLPGPDPTGRPVWRPAAVEPDLGRLLLVEATSLATVSQLVMVVVLAIVAPVVAWRVLPLDDVDRAPLLALAVPGLALLATLLGLAARLSVFGGFQLHADPDRLRIQAGLLTEAKVAARRERLQLLEVQRDRTHRWRGLERVRYETADVEAQGTAATVYLDPAADRDSWRLLAQDAIGGIALGEDDLRPVSPRTVRRTVIRLVIPLAVVAGAAGWLWWPVGVVVGLLGLIALRWYARARYRELGWAVDDQHCLVRRGVLAGRLWIIRLDKIQAVRSRATVFQRRLGLVDVGLSTAGTGGIGLVVIPDLPVDTAEALVADLARRAARTPLTDTL